MSSLKIVPLTRGRWADLEGLFGPRGGSSGCWCMWPRVAGPEYRAGKGDGGRVNKRKMRERVEAGAPGLLGYRDKEAVAWIAVSPRRELVRIERTRALVPPDAAEVWAIPCVFVAKGARGQGLTVAMIEGAVEYAKRKGARIVEAYPLDPDARVAPGAAWWGLLPAFVKAGFVEVARREGRPIVRREL